MALRSKGVGIQDAGAPLVVDHFHRKVTVPATERVIGVVGDHCSEQVTFQLARYIDNHDMLECPIKYVAWRNVDGEPGTDGLVEMEHDEEKILLGWTIRDRLAAAKGLVEFSLHFEERDPSTNEKKYSWGTYKCTECEILDSVNAVLGTYAAIYIDGDTLVFADYTPVTADGYIDIKTPIVPKDTLEINTAGKHDVGPYAYADVKGIYENPILEVAEGVATATANGLTASVELDAPTVEVLGSGKVTATANGLKTEHQLSAQDCSLLVPANIRAGANIFGVKGAMYPLKTMQLLFENRHTRAMYVEVTVEDTKHRGSLATERYTVPAESSTAFTVVRGGTLWCCCEFGLEEVTLTLPGEESTQNSVYNQMADKWTKIALPKDALWDVRVVANVKEVIQ